MEEANPKALIDRPNGPTPASSAAQTPPACANFCYYYRFFLEQVRTLAKWQLGW
jgi:hypothetical protein